MQPSAGIDYLANEIRTAAPQKLRLMLIEGALRCGRQALEFWRDQDREQASEALIRCQQIVTELICSLDSRHHSQLVGRIAGIYLFIFRSLVAAHLHQDEARLAEAMSVLEVERETWRQVCANHLSAADSQAERERSDFSA